MVVKVWNTGRERIILLSASFRPFQREQAFGSECFYKFWFWKRFQCFHFSRINKKKRNNFSSWSHSDLTHSPWIFELPLLLHPQVYTKWLWIFRIEEEGQMSWLCRYSTKCTLSINPCFVGGWKIACESFTSQRLQMPMPILKYNFTVTPSRSAFFIFIKSFQINLVRCWLTVRCFHEKLMSLNFLQE